MLIIKHTVETMATPSQIWKIWQDVANWNSWDEGIEFARLNGPFQAGSLGCIKPFDGPLLKTQLIKVVPNELFIQEAKLLWAKAVMTHSISLDNGITQVTFQTDIQGPLAFFYSCFIGNSIRKKIPVEMKAMLEKAILVME